MASSLISNPEANSNPSRELKRKKRNNIETQTQSEQVQKNRIRWRTQAEQQIYSSKLIEALRQVRLNSSSRATSTVGGRAVRDTADRVLAVAAKGRTRWSRAILTNRLRLQMKNNKHKRHSKVKVSGVIPSTKPVVKKRLPSLERKARVLGRLVPGCRKLSFPNLLEEATDYIAALEMQVRAMSALAGMLTGTASTTATPSYGPGSNQS